MGAKTLTGTVVGLAVVIILAATLLMPVLNDATTTHETFDNSQYSYYYMKELEVGDIWTRTDDVWYYGDEALTASSNTEVSIIATDTIVVRQDGYSYGTTYYSTNTTASEVVEVDSDVYLLVNTGTNVAYTSGYGATIDGDLVMKTYTDAGYVNGDTALWVTGITKMASDGSSRVVVNVSGNIEDGFTATATTVRGGDITDIVASDYVVNYEAVDGYEDLYTITSVQFTLTGDRSGTEVSTTATYSTFIMPKEVTAERAVHFTDGENAMISMIPVIIIASIVIAAVTMVAGRRD